MSNIFQKLAALFGSSKSPAPVATPLVPPAPALYTPPTVTIGLTTADRNALIQSLHTSAEIQGNYAVEIPESAASFRAAQAAYDDATKRLANYPNP